MVKSVKRVSVEQLFQQFADIAPNGETAASRLVRALRAGRLPSMPSPVRDGRNRPGQRWSSVLLSDGVDAPFRRHRNVPCWRCSQRQERKGASMERVSMIGIDLAKNSFQVHGARADGSVAFRRKLSRAKILDFMASQQRCTVVMEACASAHYWGREIGGLGHAVRLIPPVYVKAYVKRQKNDAADAEAICEAASRPTMSFVAVKTKEQQARGMLFRTRDLLVRQRTQTINALRGHLAEFGIVAPKGAGPYPSPGVGARGSGHRTCRRRSARWVASCLSRLKVSMGRSETWSGRFIRLRGRMRTCKRLMTVPGIGPITAMAIHAFAPPMESFQRGRDFSAWLGLVPRQHTTGGKPRLGKISKMGQRDLRRLLITGAMTVVRWATRRGRTDDPWLAQDAGAQAEDAGCGGAGQPDGAYRLGADDEEGDLPGSRARSRLRGWQSAGSRRGCGQVGGQARANGRRDGIGKTSFARRAFELA